MRITTLTLRNYRVFRELDIEFPAGLVGVYGANGAGKSSMLESIVWALYGRARTGKGEIRTAGETGECFVELGFEHEENYYLVRRSLSGKNATVKARVSVGSAVVADGVTDVAKYLQSVLGLDELAFRSSVFAEQKQLAAFSEQSPDQRRKLVLQLLGITPIEKARDAARTDYRQRQKEHTTLQSILGTLTASEERVSAAELEAKAAGDALTKAEAAFQKHESELALAQAEFAAVDSAAKESERIKSLGAAVRKRRDDLAANLAAIAADVLVAEEASAMIATVAPASKENLQALELRLDALQEWQRAKEQLESLGQPTPAEDSVEPDESDVQQARSARDEAATIHASASALVKAANARLVQARTVADRHELLTATDDCPLCGQALGDGFSDVRQHAIAEVAEAAKECAQLVNDEKDAKKRLDACTALLTKAQRAYEADRTAFKRTQQVAQRRSDAQVALKDAEAKVGQTPSVKDIAKLKTEIGELHERRTRVAQLQERAGRLADLRTREAEIAGQLADAEGERVALLAEHRALEFDREAFEKSRAKLTSSQRNVVEARSLLDSVRVAHARSSQQAHDAAIALAEAAEKQQALQNLELDARYLGRTADLLSGFRQAIVAMVGPQLSTHASALFNELTAGEYDGLQIDGETYAINVIDGGVPYSSERFSGSEVDLANLALRVAISEQIRFQAGGQVGLLVLDEALASLDSDRKDRMLAALTRLGGRFRQILVVTHSPEVKERLPQAIEVRRTSRQGSTARVIDQAPL
jgi:DNA repair exonuclease SbcCD ATPase subunit